MAHSKELWDKAKGYYEAGLSLSKIKDKTGIDRTAISKRAKNQQWKQGKNSDYIEAKEVIAIKKSTENQQSINILDEIAEERIANKKLIQANSDKLAGKILLMADTIDSTSDVKNLVDANDKLSVTMGVNQRHANTPSVAIQNNTQVNIKPFSSLYTNNED